MIPATYTAKEFRVQTLGRTFQMSGTLDGFIDFCVKEDSGGHWTVTLDCSEARVLAAALLGAAEDIQANCLFDRDALLIR
jgi:hypothetical protein